MRLHLDLETFCMLDLKKVGLYRYVGHHSFQILLAAWAMDDGPVMCEEGISDALETALHQADEIHAYNAAFERLALMHGAGIDLSPVAFRCTMVHAWSLGFFGDLESVRKQMGRPLESQKLQSGKRLIRMFCKPRKLTKRNPNLRVLPHDKPMEWLEFKHYNIQDVEAERDLYRFLTAYPMPAKEQRLYAVDQQINDLGVPVDLPLIDQACDIYEAEKAQLKNKLQSVTGLDNPNSVQQLTQWFAEKQVVMPNLQKDTVASALTLPEMPPEPRQALELRQRLAQTSAEKWHAWLRMTNPHDCRVRGLLAMNGASRTLRWAGRGVQIHNLPWTRINTPGLPEFLTRCGVEGIPVLEALYGDVLGVLTSTLRNAIRAPRGRTLVVSDYANIESRIIAWVSNCERLNAIFRTGGDPYKDFASQLYNVPIEEVTKEQRTFCKPPSLGCGYQLSPNGLVEYAASMGVEMEDAEAEQAVFTFRRVYPEIPSMWRWLVDACIHITRAPIGTILSGYAVHIVRDENFLFIVLPSGHQLSYFSPEVRVHPKFNRESFTYMGKNQYTAQWDRLYTHGGKIAENIVQAIARDKLAEDLVTLWLKPLDVSLHVHDEIGTEADEEKAPETLQVMEEVMSVTPDWLPGCIFTTEGYIAERYRK
jgi:DNA polymerase